MKGIKKKMNKNIENAVFYHPVKFHMQAFQNIPYKFRVGQLTRP